MCLFGILDAGTWHLDFVIFFNLFYLTYTAFVIPSLLPKNLNAKDSSNKFMVSFDVVCLFTSIPLKECIDFAVSYISDGWTDLKLSKSDLTKLFSIGTSETQFLFNGIIYEQIDGPAMGSPLAPVLASLFLGHYENQWLSNYRGPSIHLYRRYVDETFCLFGNEHDSLLFFEFLNS